MKKRSKEICKLMNLLQELNSSTENTENILNAKFDLSVFYVGFLLFLACDRIQRDIKILYSSYWFE